MGKNLSERIKYMGFIMICMMVLYHSPIIDNTYALNPIDYFANKLFSDAVSSLGALVMCYFFTVTGFLLFQNFSIKSYPVKIKRRVYSLLVPYLMWQLIILAKELICHKYQFDLSDFFSRTFLLLCWPIDGPLWYAYAVFLLSLVSPFLLLFFRKNRNLAWLFVLALILLIQAGLKYDIGILKKISDYGYVGNILTYLPCYLIGAYYGYYHKEASPGALYHLLSVLLMAFLLDCVFSGFFYNMAMMILPIAALFLLPPVPFLHGRKIYSLSFLMYALHQPLISDLWSPVLDIYTLTIGKLTMSVALCSVVTHFMLLTCVFAVAAAIYFSLSKIAPSFLALLTGGRS